MSYHVLIAKHFPIQIVHRNFVKIVIECPIVISEYFISLFSNLIWILFFLASKDIAKNFMQVIINMPVRFVHRIIMKLLVFHLLFHYQNQN